MKKQLFKIIKTAFFVSTVIFSSTNQSLAVCNQFGETGLLSISTAETIANGTTCLGLWTDIGSMKDGSTNKTMPLSATFGLSRSLEMMISNPNLFFNDDNDTSGRGFANMGLKLRFLGNNVSPLKAAFSASVLRSLYSKESSSEFTDLEGKVLVGTRTEKIKLHASFGFRKAGGANDRDDGMSIGAAAEFLYHRRYRYFIESEWKASQAAGLDDSIRVTPGIHYFLTPSLIFYGGLDFYLSDSDPKRRIILGFSTFGGVGTYVVPIPKISVPVVADQRDRGKPPVPILPSMLMVKAEPDEVAPSLPATSVEIDTEDTDFSLQHEVTLSPLELKAITLPPAVLASVPGEVLATKARAKRKFRLPDAVFDFGSATLSSAAEAAIWLVVKALTETEGTFFVRIEGHTDSVGSEEYNKKLSLRRATAIANEMTEKFGIPEERVIIEPYGETRPIATNDTREGRQLNRRVDIILIVPEL